MSSEAVPQDETEEFSALFAQHEYAAELFARHWQLLDTHAILEVAIVVTDELPPGPETDARVYRIAQTTAAHTERGGVCLFPAGEPTSRHRVNIDVYSLYGQVPMPENTFTDEQMQVILCLAQELELERHCGQLPGLSADLTHLPPLFPDINPYP